MNPKRRHPFRVTGQLRNIPPGCYTLRLGDIPGVVPTYRHPAGELKRRGRDTAAGGLTAARMAQIAGCGKTNDMSHQNPGKIPRLRDRPASEREALASRIGARMDGPMTGLGLIFLMLVLAETLVRPQGALGLAFSIASWVLWAAFVAEFILRATVAPSATRFLKRNWWQLIFLLLPFLRFARVLGRLRLGRVGRVISSGVRTGRSARVALSSRLGWLAAVTVIVILAASQITFDLGESTEYGTALYEAAMATIVGQPIPTRSDPVRVINVILGLYSVVVFAALAATLGAFFLDGTRERERAAAESDSETLATEA